MLERARVLHDAALTAQAAADPELSPGEALRRAEAAAADAAVLVEVLLAIIRLLQGPFLAAGSGGGAVLGVDEPGDADRNRLPLVAAVVRSTAVVRADDALARLAAVREVQVAAFRLADEIEPGVVRGEAAADHEHVLALARLACLLQHHGDEVLVLQWRISGQALGPYAAELVPWAVPVSRALAAGGAARSFLERVGDGSKGSRSGGLYAAGVLCLALVSAAAGVVIAGGRAPAADVAGDVPPRVSVTMVMPSPGLLPSGGAGGGSPAAATPGPGSASPTYANALPGGPGKPQRTAPAAPPPDGASARPTSGASPSASATGGHGVPGRHAAPPLPDGLFRLTGVASRMCLSTPRNSDIPAAGMVQTTCAADAEQFWRLTPEKTGREGTVYAVRNRFSGLCLSVDAARTTDDAIITHYPCGDEAGLFPDQFWSFRYRPSHRAWQLVNRNSGKCVAIRPGGADLEQALQSTCADDPWMLWRP
ncbi:RICIN domain-containing protein [Streptomyces sp. NBC_01268]|uniref:RICIN domain-containing protein n=1 Tax=Streptomyces sp. NBC_01268 TaxID=2903806 RepID=UPI002E32B839|nr:RICIN domain-containing protein [Streptomyces sp. NBC_01268]